MNQYQTERRLCWCYGLLTVLLGISVICIAVPFNYWRSSLDVCPGSYFENTNCGCIFYGVGSTNYFSGGHNSNCHYAIFAPLPILVYAIIMSLFHMYRVCINNVGQYEDEKTTELEEIEGESIVVTSRQRVTERNDSVIYCWVPSTCLSVIFAIYNLVHSSIITDGYFKTCTHYRGYLVNVLPAIGEHASTIHFRLGCQAIFDFMDMTHRGAPNSRREDFINTGVALQLALISSWFAVVLWVAVAYYTAKSAYKERSVLTCCGN